MIDGLKNIFKFSYVAGIATALFLSCGGHEDLNDSMAIRQQTSQHVLYSFDGSSFEKGDRSVAERMHMRWRAYGPSVYFSGSKDLIFARDAMQIRDAAFDHICKVAASRNSTFYLSGLSRGAIIALAVAKDLYTKNCPNGAKPLVRWIGLVDAVDSGLLFNDWPKVAPREPVTIHVTKEKTFEHIFTTAELSNIDETQKLTGLNHAEIGFLNLPVDSFFESLCKLNRKMFCNNDAL